MIRGAVALLIALTCTLCPTLAQQKVRKDKPVLIRADRTSDETKEPEVVTPDPQQAKKNLEIGDFYFKRGNLEAARERYRDAILYAPRSPEGYTRLVRVLEQMEQFEQAIEVCQSFLNSNPNSKKRDEFLQKLERLRAQVSG